jgi:hypothetical protein
VRECGTYNHDIVLVREVLAVEATDQVLVVDLRLLLRFGVLRDVVVACLGHLVFVLML